MWLNLHADILEEFVEADRICNGHGLPHEWFEGVTIIKRRSSLLGPVKGNAQRLREYRKRNRERVNASARERNRAAYAKNRAKHKARVKAWKAANRERVNAAARRRAARTS